MNSKVLTHILCNIYPQYHPLDKYGHGLEHILQVTKNAIESAHRKGIAEDYAIIVAAYHDLGLVQGREGHEARSAEIFMNDPIITEHYALDIRKWMNNAILSHRSSSFEVPTEPLSNTLFEADKDYRPEVVFARYIQASRNLWVDVNDCYENTIREVNERCGVNGRLVNQLAEKRNLSDIKHLQEVLADEDRCRSLFSSLFAYHRKELENDLWMIITAPIPTHYEDRVFYSYEGYTVMKVSRFDYPENCEFNIRGACVAPTTRTKKMCGSKQCPIYRHKELFPTTVGHRSSKLKREV